MFLKNPLLLYGLLLAAIPVVLHLMMRSKPKKMPFPALRLVQARRKSNTQRLRLRHLWLLLLRIAVIVLIVLALTRPVLPAANYGPSTLELLAALGILGLLGGGYWFLMRRWSDQEMPRHRLLTRRTYLRGGLGTLGLLLFALLVAWPYANRVRAEITEPVASDLPVAAIFVFDTSLSMEYQSRNRSRLEAAKEIAKGHLTSLPRRSQVAIAETGDPEPPRFYRDPLGISNRLEALEPTPRTIPLDQIVLDAVELHREERSRLMSDQGDIPEEARTDQFLREIYIFTDLAVSAWRGATTKTLANRLEELKSIHIYIIDVGVEQPKNSSLSELQLSSQTVLSNGTLTIETTASTTDPEASPRMIELSILGETGEPVVKEKVSAPLAFGSPTALDFQLPKLKPNRFGRLVQGELRLKGRDPLAFDDVRYFTVRIVDAPRILIVSPTVGESLFMSEALAPRGLREEGLAPFRVDSIRPSEIDSTTLGDYEVIALLNLPRLENTTWARFGEYVENGGGLVVALGSKGVEPSGYATEAARSLLPTATLKAPLYFQPPEYLDVLQPEHPLFGEFQDGQGLGLITGTDILRAWSVTPVKSASVLARYTGLDRPAILERAVGSGRVLMFTTALDGTNNFNDLPGTWPYLVLCHRMMRVLGGSTDVNVNRTAGQEVTLRNDRQLPLERYTLKLPTLEQRLGKLDDGEAVLEFGSLPDPGNYQLIDRNRDLDTSGPPRNTGFSLNVPERESNLTRLTTADLDERLGAERYDVARSVEQLDRVVTSDRIGREVFPTVMALLLFFFILEHLAANNFHQRPASAGPVPSASLSEPRPVGPLAGE